MCVPLVLVVEDNAALRDLFCELLRTAGFCVHGFQSGEALLSTPVFRNADCMLVDIKLPGIDGFELTERLCKRDCHAPVIFMTGHEDTARILKFGKAEFLEKPISNRVLLDRIDRTLKCGRCGDECRRHLAAQTVVRLAPREQQILKCLLDGKTNKHMACELKISVRTVEVYRKRLMLKTQAHSVAELVRLSLSAGLAEETVR